MAFETFIEKSFQAKTLAKIEHANVIIRQYQAQGYQLTLRQLYYQFVSRDLIPNKQSEYKTLGEIVNNARLAGLIDWDAIHDRTRNLVRSPSWSSPADILNAVAKQYQEDPWRTQPYAPEVWIEKDALVGVIERVCKQNRVPYFACRGYASQSEIYSAGKRQAAAKRSGKIPIILHLGDHDPSGLDMTRDNTDRVSMFARRGIEVRRLALNMDQIEEYDPPPNPAKDTDARFASYQEEHGDSSWELDALEPSVIEKLIRDELETLIDPDPWAAAQKEEAKQRRALQRIVDGYSSLPRILANLPLTDELLDAAEEDVDRDPLVDPDEEEDANDGEDDVADE